MIVVPKGLRYDRFGILIVGKVVWPDVFTLEGAVERFDMAILLWRVGADEAKTYT